MFWWCYDYKNGCAKWIFDTDVHWLFMEYDREYDREAPCWWNVWCVPFLLVSTLVPHWWRSQIAFACSSLSGVYPHVQTQQYHTKTHTQHIRWLYSTLYIHISIYTYIYIRMYIYICVCVYIYIYVYIYIWCFYIWCYNIWCCILLYPH